MPQSLSRYAFVIAIPIISGEAIPNSRDRHGRPGRPRDDVYDYGNTSIAFSS
jgi:hypothetical protein